MGRSIINWSSVIDSTLSGESEHPLTNKAATEEFLRQQNLMTEQINRVTTLINNVKAMRVSTDTAGMVQLTTISNITDPNAYALSATDKNPNFIGSLAWQLARIGTAVSSTSSGNHPITAAYTDVTVASVKIPTAGSYLIIGTMYANDPNITIYSKIFADNVPIRAMIHGANNVFDAHAQIITYHELGADQTVTLSLQANQANGNKICNGDICCIRLK